MRKLDVKQKSYFSFDVVDFFNNNKYALVGEEIYGLPGIGFFEAMACGCTLLGQSGRFYNSLGLVSGSITLGMMEHSMVSNAPSTFCVRTQKRPKK